MDVRTPAERRGFPMPVPVESVLEMRSELELRFEFRGSDRLLQDLLTDLDHYLCGMPAKHPHIRSTIGGLCRSRNILFFPSTGPFDWLFEVHPRE